MNREKWVPSGYNKEGENLIVCKDVEPLEPLYTASRNVQFKKHNILYFSINRNVGGAWGEKEETNMTL